MSPVSALLLLGLAGVVGLTVAASRSAVAA